MTGNLVASSDLSIAANAKVTGNSEQLVQFIQQIFF